VVIDERGRRLILYFHGLDGPGYQPSRIAVSDNGIDFDVLNDMVFSNYLRGFQFRDQFYLLGMPGILYRSSRPDGDFIPRSSSL
jgi:hypothetical protein